MRKRSVILLSVFLFIVAGIFSCNNSDETDELVFNFQFNDSKEGFEAAFADYPVNDDDRINSEFVLADLPSPIDQPNTKSLKISGTNISDDLFMFVYKKIEGLQPNTQYQLIFNIELASKYPESAPGVGGSPGASVFLKIGAVNFQPEIVQGDLGYVANVVNFDKGNQSTGGEDMIVIGNIGIPGDDFEYQLIERNNESNPFAVKSSAEGHLWILVGTDSGFEATTTLFYNQITLRIN